MNNWNEVLPGFWLPNSWAWTEERWPDYTADAYVRALSDTPDISNIIKIRGYGQPEPRQWGAWFGAFNADKLIERESEFLAVIADRMYESARYKYLVPAWRRTLVEVLTEIDDIEDQLSTLLWVAETVTRKWIPIPAGLLHSAGKITATVDCAGKLVAGITPFRGAKSGYADCLAEIDRKKRRAREQKAGLIAWFQENWGRLLEAAQATNTWFDVGIVLGPIMAYVDEGLWGLTKATAENYLLATDALFPGYAQFAKETDQRINDAVAEAWDSTWGALDEWDNEQIGEWAGL